MTRVCPTHRFTTPAGLASLERVLKAYAAADPEVNYCQARSLGAFMWTLLKALQLGPGHGMPPGCEAVHVWLRLGILGVGWAP